MKRWIAGFLACMLVACASIALAGCQSATYKPTAKSPAVSATALVSDGELRVGVNVKNNPMAGVMSDSSIVGIDADVAAALADEMGLKLVLVDVGDDPEGALNEKKVDIVLGVKAQDDTTSGCWKSDPYIYTAAALFGTRAETSVPTVDSSPIIAAQVAADTGQKSLSAGAVIKLYGEGSLEGHNDLEEALGTLSSGSVRYAAGDAVKGMYAANYKNYDAKVIALLEEPNGYCVAVAQSNTELQGAVKSALSKVVTGGMMNIIETKWLGGPSNLTAITVVKSSAADAGEQATHQEAEKPAEEAPAEEASAEDAPAAEEAPAEEVPAEEVPAEDAQPAA